jgi:glycerophosphoryl diester phosphodiesterase
MPLLLGHRGARATKDIPENTLASFDRALQHGCDGFEFDVRLTKDRVAVVCHDAHWQGRNIAKSSRPDLAELPTLDEVLDRYPASVFLDIELKVEGLEDSVVNLLAKRGDALGIVVTSFLPEVVQKTKAALPDLACGLICEKQSELKKYPEVSCEWLMLERALVSNELVSSVHAAGRKLGVWTVNRAADMQSFADWGVDAIISDDTELLIATLRP